MQVKATNEEANQVFTEWDLAIESLEHLERILEVMSGILKPQDSDSLEKDLSFLRRAQEITEKVKNFKWRMGFAVLAMSLVCKGRRFFTSRKGFMGLAPDIAEVGDKISLVSGCCTPLILIHDGPNFSLVGESYVHGVMDGRLISDAAFQDINLV